MNFSKQLCDVWRMGSLGGFGVLMSWFQPCWLRPKVKVVPGILLVMASRVVPQHQQIISSFETESLTQINRAGGTDNTLERFLHHAEPELISRYQTDGVSAYTAFSHALQQACARALLRFLALPQRQPGEIVASHRGHCLPGSKGHWFKSHLSCTTDVSHLSWPATGTNKDSLIGKG